ncbi:Glutathione amide reductase [Hartmannibacter diazotrophicus]|uniref:Glutathione reductase n=1 Tax=Hartmannibacter diazotrophicus TaxID=1482074 RepID=A0A2C9D8C0_9HYPH|nr:glutathione-disulfide reductase [Hartmannibacter diazotrophicus]SON56378.1 Glutathione amide reductase [Hartmannibacter diazotrophicus]
MPTYDYDLFVIGAGSGGVRAARIASGYGARVAIAEEYRVGGTCVIRGCVPKKLLVYASRFGDEFEDAAGFGWSVGETSFDWATLIGNKDKEIDRLERAYVSNLEKAKVEIIPARGELTDAHTVRLSTGRSVTAERILIATGGRPFVPEFPGREHVITSNEAFHLAELPKRVVVLGGGYIASEFACIFAGLGAKTTQLYRGKQILRGFDVELAGAVQEEMIKRGVDVRVGTDVVSVEKTDAGFRVRTTTGDTIETDCVMAATGRVPNTNGLGLETAGVETKANGAIAVDAMSQTSAPNIYAVGDVTDRVNLTPVAIREGHAFADTVYGGKEVVVDHSLIPTAVFTTPELGTVGLTQEQALERCGALDIYRARFRPMKMTLAGRDEKMFMKLLVDMETDKVLGAHIMGPDAGEFAQLLGIVISMGARKADFDRTMAVHPTATEELVTMRTPSESIRREEVLEPSPVNME